MEEHTGFVLHGGVLYSQDKDTLVSLPDAYVVCVDGVSQGVFEELPEEFENLPMEDCWDKVIVPGFVNLGVHAPGYQIRGLSTELDDETWRDGVLLPEEENYSDPTYAARAYDIFVENLFVGATTRAVVSGTRHMDATVKLMDFLEEAGLVTFVGPSLADQGLAGEFLVPAKSMMEDLEKWLESAGEKYERTYPVLIPREPRLCTEELGQILLDLNVGYGAMSSLLIESYHGLKSDLALTREKMDQGLPVGLRRGSGRCGDISIFSAMRDAMNVSKLQAAESQDGMEPFSFEEVFYMATLGGGTYFGEVGSFEEGYEFDAVVIDDSNQDTLYEFEPRERIERLLDCADDRNVVGKYVQGNKLY
ncbi:MAG: amidohydrolase family protein [Lachnospiraceae bacterium]|nr:amidohydrolase family protein [Lachnospiraceae bacterium]